MIYGFSDRETATKLKELADSIGAQPSQSSTPATESGSRVFLVSLTKDLEAASKSETSSLIPSTGTANLWKRDLSTEELQTRKNDFSQTDYEMKVKSVSGNKIPKTSDPSNPEELHLAVQDSFGTLYLIPEASELFGTLESDWTPGDEEAQTINLSAGFERSETFAAYPAPTLSEALPAETPVTCRFVKALKKWFFFRPSRSGSATAILSVRGTALGCFGEYEGKEIWATQLALGSEEVRLYDSVAIQTGVKAIGSDSSKPWIQFPTLATDSFNSTFSSGMTQAGPDYVFDQYLKLGDEIFLKSDLGTLYQREGEIFYPSFRTLDGSPFWQTSGSGPLYLYPNAYANGSGYAIDFILGRIIDPNDENESSPHSYQLSELVSEYDKPIWKCETEFGVYSCEGQEDIIFGVPQFLATLQATDSNPDEGLQESSPFVRSLKPVETLESGPLWKYSGSLTVREGEELFKYENVSPQDQGRLWILGRLEDTQNGWYQSDSALQADSSSPTTFTFCVVERDPLTFTVNELLLDRLSSLQEDENANGGEGSFFLPDGKAARWSLAEADRDLTFTFSFNAPSPLTTGDDLEITLDQLLRQEVEPFPTLQAVAQAEDGQTVKLWVVGDYGSEEGWLEAPFSDLEETLTFNHGPNPRGEITLTFDQYVEGAFTETIWQITPEILT